jgi:hypothetical protein
VCGQLKSAAVDLESVLDRAATDDAVAGLRVSVLIESLPRIGPRRAASAMAQLRISPSRRLRGLGPTQRAALLKFAMSAPAKSAPAKSQ